MPLKAWVKNALDHIIQECMNEPSLEFVWVGDDAVDPLQQAQTLQILVGAGIKTREEARADLGLGPSGGRKPVADDNAAKALRKFNPHHDERGQFSTADNAVATVGSPARKPRPTGVQVASLDNNIATDAAVDGGTADEAAVAQMDPDAGADGTPTASTRTESPGDAGPGKPPPEQKLKTVYDVPDVAVSYTTGDGTQFHAPPDADFRKVYAAGRANGRALRAVRSAIGQFGTYAFQRKDGHFYTAYMDASNYAAGVYMAGAGYSYFETIAMGTGF